MKKLISAAAACIVLCSCGGSQRADEQGNVELEQEDTLLVVENQNVIGFSEKIITDIKGLEHIAIGASFSAVKKKYPNYIFEESGRGGGWLYKFSDKDKSFYLFLIGYDDTILGIEFSDTSFKLYNGLKVGDPVSKIKEKYPNIPIGYNHHDGAEEFTIKDANSIIYITVESNDRELLGEYEKDEIGYIEKAVKYRTDGEITWILIQKK